MSQLVRSGSEDFSQQLTMVSIFQGFDPSGFHGRLSRWCEATGFPIEPGWSVYDILAMLDDDRLIKLGAALRKTFFKEIQEVARRSTHGD